MDTNELKALSYDELLEKSANQWQFFLLTNISMNSMICITKERGVDVENSTGKYAWTATVGTKGQIVIPKEAREIFNIKPGDTLIILADKEQGIAIPPKNTFEKYFQMIFGENK